MSSLSYMFGALPRHIRVRFNGIPAYVKSIINDKEANTPKNLKARRSEVEQIQALVQLILLDRFLQRGTEAAKAAVKALEEVGTTGFSVGTTEFKGENDAVMRGARLSKRLRESVPEIGPLSDRYAAQSVAQLTDTIRGLVQRA